ncbi:MAG: hypothetical protein RIR73_2506, partial [Chloroflexota bacterium]
MENSFIEELMKIKFKKLTGWIVAVAFLVVFAYSPLFTSEAVLDAFAREDSIFETLSPIYLFVCCVLLGIAWWREKKNIASYRFHWVFRLSLLAFAMVFFVAAAEEVSWGQRIFGIETPNLIKDVNVQKEITLHNLILFQGEDAILPVSFDQLSAVFSLMFGFGLPIGNWILKRFKLGVETLMPIMPLMVGWLMPLNYALQKFLMQLFRSYPQYYLHPEMHFSQPIYEIREHNYAFALMVCVV